MQKPHPAPHSSQPAVESHALPERVVLLILWANQHQVISAAMLERRTGASESGKSLHELHQILIDCSSITILGQYWLFARSSDDGIPEHNQGLKRNIRGKLSPYVKQVQRKHVLVHFHIGGFSRMFPNMRLQWCMACTKPLALNAGYSVQLGRVEVAIGGNRYGLQSEGSGHAEKQLLARPFRFLSAACDHVAFALGKAFAHGRCRRRIMCTTVWRWRVAKSRVFRVSRKCPRKFGRNKNCLRFFRRRIVYRAWQSSIVGDAVGHPVHDTTIWVVGAETEADSRYVVLASLTHIHCG